MENIILFYWIRRMSWVLAIIEDRGYRYRNNSNSNRVWWSDLTHFLKEGHSCVLCSGSTYLAMASISRLVQHSTSLNLTRLSSRHNSTNTTFPRSPYTHTQHNTNTFPVASPPSAPCFNHLPIKYLSLTPNFPLSRLSRYPQPWTWLIFKGLQFFFISFLLQNFITIIRVTYCTFETRYSYYAYLFLFKFRLQWSRWY